MIFVHTVSTPAGTTEASPQRTELSLNLGILHRLDVGFPPGPQGLLHAAIERDGRQLYPSNPQGDFAWDDSIQNYPTWFELEVEPFAVVARTWNDDVTYAHDVTLTFLILPREVLQPPRPEAGILQRLGAVVGGRRPAG